MWLLVVLLAVLGNLSFYFSQEYLSTECVSNYSLMEISNVTRSRSILNMAECSQRKLVTALSHHVTYGRQWIY